MTEKKCTLNDIPFYQYMALWTLAGLTVLGIQWTISKVNAQILPNINTTPLGWNETQNYFIEKFTDGLNECYILQDINLKAVGISCLK